MEFIVINEQDVALMHDWYEKGTYPEYFRSAPPNCTPEQLAMLMRLGGDTFRIIVEDKHVGWITAGMHPFTRMASCGIIVFDEYLNKGYAAEAVKKAAKFIFNSMKALKLVCVCSRDDKRSMYILEKAKFLPEARLRGNTYYSGAIHDEIRWTMPRDKYYKLYGKE